jgi:tRNA G26 N,N-dimethylase Trm1
VVLPYAIIAPFGQIAGPMWSGPLHDSEFVAKVLAHLEDNEDQYGTSTRMKGMLTVAQEVRLIVSHCHPLTCA